MLPVMSTTGASQDRLLHEQVRLLARNVPALVVGTLVLATGTAALLSMEGQSQGWVLAWLGAMVALCAVRWLGAQRYFRSPPDLADAPRWARWFVVASAVAGLLWGSLAALFFSPEDPHTQAVVVMVLAAIVASATQSLGPYFPAHLAFGLPALVPFALRCMTSGDARTITLGVLALVFLVMAELFARRIAAAIEEALRLRFENEALVSQLSRAKDLAEAANRAKTRFLASASHDLRQPIHALGLFVPALQGMAQREQVTPQALAVVADRMQLALRTMSQLLGRLLNVSRLDAGAVDVEPRVLELEPAMLAALDEVSGPARAKGLRLRLHETGLWVHSDPAVLHSILSNLLSNAVRYTERGAILVAARRRGGRALLQVWDTGIGIAEADQARLSEEFFQGGNAHEDPSQPRGFGLGLAIAQRSAQLLGTSLRWRSTLGKGSVFELTLPLAEPPTATLPEQAPAQPPAEDFPPAPQATGSTDPIGMGASAILVVDEDEDILASMAFLLKTWGHEVLVARTLQEAQRLARDSGHRIGAAFVDYHLSPEEDGLAVAAMLRAQIRSDLPLAIITGDTTPEVMAAVREARLVLLHKPADAKAMKGFVASARHPAG
jgi:signal transduction histidine kinase